MQSHNLRCGEDLRRSEALLMVPIGGPEDTSCVMRSHIWTRSSSSAPNEETLELCLSAAVLLKLRRVGRQHAVDDGLQRRRVRDLHQSLCLHERLYAVFTGTLRKTLTQTQIL